MHEMQRDTQRRPYKVRGREEWGAGTSSNGNIPFEMAFEMSNDSRVRHPGRGAPLTNHDHKESDWISLNSLNSYSRLTFDNIAHAARHLDWIPGRLGR